MASVLLPAPEIDASYCADKAAVLPMTRFPIRVRQRPDWILRRTATRRAPTKPTRDTLLQSIRRFSRNGSSSEWQPDVRTANAHSAKRARLSEGISIAQRLRVADLDPLPYVAAGVDAGTESSRSAANRPGTTAFSGIEAEIWMGGDCNARRRGTVIDASLGGVAVALAQPVEIGLRLAIGLPPFGDVGTAIPAIVERCDLREGGRHLVVCRFDRKPSAAFLKAVSDGLFAAVLIGDESTDADV